MATRAEVQPWPPPEPPCMLAPCLPNSLVPAEQASPEQQWGEPGQLDSGKEEDEVTAWRSSRSRSSATLEERLETWMRQFDVKLEALLDVCGALAGSGSLAQPSGSRSLDTVRPRSGMSQRRTSTIRKSMERALGSRRTRPSTNSKFSTFAVVPATDACGSSPHELVGTSGWACAPSEAGLECDVGRDPNAVLTRSGSGRSVKSGGHKNCFALMEAIDSNSSSTVVPTNNNQVGTSSSSDEPPRSAGRHNERGDMRKNHSMMSMESTSAASGAASPAKDEQFEKKLKLRAQSLRVEGDYPRTKSVLASVLRNKSFEAFITAVVVINALLIGAQTEFVARNPGDNERGLEAFLFYSEHICTLIFFVELLVRVAVHGRRFFTSSTEQYWNLFDVFLVGVALLDLFVMFLHRDQRGGLPSSGAFLGKLLRALRMTKVMRILRTVRFVSELRVMVQMIVNSMLSLFWVLVILVALIYTFSIVLTSGATEYLQPHDGVVPHDSEKVHDYFGSLFETMYTLYKTIAGGLDWGEVSDILRGPGWVYEAVIICYTLFTTFAVVNIVTGVFVDGAIELAKRDRTLLIHKHAKDQFAHQGHLIGLLQTIDSDGDDRFSPEDFRIALQRDDVKEFISAMHVDIPDVEAFFEMLDANSDGEVDIVEFVTGMQKLRGEARSVDIHMMMHQTMKTLQMVTSLVERMQAAESDVCSEASNVEHTR